MLIALLSVWVEVIWPQSLDVISKPFDAELYSSLASSLAYMGNKTLLYNQSVLACVCACTWENETLLLN